MEERSRPVLRPATSVAHAALSVRLLAWSVDIVFVWVGVGILGSFVSPIIRGLYESQPSMIGPFLDVMGDWWRSVGITVALHLILVGVPYVGAYRTLRASPGQHLVGHMTVRSDTGARLGIGTAAARFLALFGPMVVVNVVPSILYFSPGMPGTDWSIVVPEVSRVVGAAWYVLLLASTARSVDGRGLQDVLTRSTVVRRV